MAEEVDLKQKDLLKFGMMMWKLKPFVGKSGTGAVERWEGRVRVSYSRTPCAA